jgi:hypothetical protein
MNKAYEFIGTLEYAPLNKEERERRAEMLKEQGYLPPNMIPDMDKYPVLHVMEYLEHPYKNATKFWNEIPELDSGRIAEIRDKLFEILTDIYGGDEVVAEYVLLTLLSKVQNREDGMPVGISCINLYSTDETVSSEILKGTERFMKLLTAHTLSAQVDLDSLCSVKMVPKKDYDTNRLSRGDLQILNSTTVLFDETMMKEGKKESEDLIHNMQGIASLIEEQSVKYNFQYHDQSFECSAPVIIISTGRSIFKNALPVPVNSKNPPNPDALNALTEEQLTDFRAYFNQVSRKGHMDIPEECSKHIQEKFIETRAIEDKQIQEKQKETKDVGARTLHTWLTYSRLNVVSQGKNECSTSVIDHVIDMENARTTRVADILSKDN